MKHTKTTRNALFASVMSLLLCVSMLIGSTFAWFTDVAESTGNKIQAGTLQIELWEGATDISKSETPIFNHTNWEPGYSEYADLTVKNVGTLSLKYQLVFQNIVTTGDADITEVLDVTIGNTYVGTLKELGETYVLASGNLLAGATADLERITVKMQETAGNIYQGCGVTFDVQLRAVQYNHEADGFGNTDYDVNANGNPNYPEFNDTITGVSATLTVPADHTAGEAFVYTNGDESVKVAIANANAADQYEVEVEPVKVAETGSHTVQSNEGTLSFDISVQKNGVDAPAEITLKVEPNLPNVKLFHDGAEMAADEYEYDAENGILVIKATSYSNFTLLYQYVAEVNGHTYGTLQEAFNAAQDGDTVKLLADITMTKVDGESGKATLLNKVKTKITLNMNGKTLGIDPGADGNITGIPALISVVEGGDLTINGDGKIDVTAGENGVYGIYLNGGNATIENGTFTGGPSAVNVKVGQLNINGGSFSCIGGEAKYLINCIDTNYNDGTAVVSITGGSFKDFDPQNNAAEGANTNFVPLGYETVEADGVYTVKVDDFYSYVGTYNGEENKTIHVINTPNGMFEFAASVNDVEEGEANKTYGGQVVILSCDVDLNNRDWEPIGQTGNTNFCGIFDGNGHTISNLNVDSDAETGKYYASGLFGFLENGSVINITVDKATVKGHHWVAAVCGYIAGGYVENCHVTNATIVNTHANADACGDKTGTIVGYIQVPKENDDRQINVVNCTASDSSITVDGRDAGQIAGAAGSKNISGCTATDVTVKVVENLTCTDGSKGANIREEVIGRVLN